MPFFPGFNALDPGDDFTAGLVRSLVPVDGGAAAAGAIAPPATVIGQFLGFLAGCVMVIAMCFVTYNLLVTLWNISDTGRLMPDRASWWAPLRVAFSGLLMLPAGLGFDGGQLLVSRTALAGIGVGRAGYSLVLNAIGPQALPISEPIIPGVKHTVAGLMQNELCRALVIAAANNPNLVPVPRAIQNTIGGNTQLSGGYVTWSYSLAAGAETGPPVCGTVTVRSAVQGQTNASGQMVDMSGTQLAILQSVLASTIRPQATAIANSLWQTRQGAALAPMMSLLSSATASYTAQLTSAASALTAQLRGQFTMDAMRSGSIGLPSGFQRMQDLGWTGAGAYYAEIGRLNGLTVSLLSATPIIKPPSYDGLGPYLSPDLAPMFKAVLDFQERLNSYVNTTDSLDAPAGMADAFSGATPGEDGAGLIESLTRKLGLSEKVLNLFINAISPIANSWTDPFAAQVRLGHNLVLIAMIGYGAAGLLASSTGSAALTAWNVLTFQWGAAAATVTGHALMSALGVPVFYGLFFLLIPGLILAVILPMIPLLMWVLGILGWLALYCEAQIAVPLWMLAHMVFQGDGLHGRGLRGWAILFNLLLRPVLMLAGLVFGYFIYAAGARLWQMLFSIAAGAALSQGWLVSNLVCVIIMICMYVLAHITMAVMSFRLIQLVPQHVPSWLGLDAVDRFDTHQLAQDIGLIGLARSMEKTQTLLQSGITSISTQNSQNGLLQGQAPPRAIGMDRNVAMASEPRPPRNPEA